MLYVIYQAFLINVVSVTTETAMYAEMQETIEVDGWFVRNEQIIDTDEVGTLSFNVVDGERLANGDNIADVYQNEEDATVQQMIDKIESEIENLEAIVSLVSTTGASAENVGTQINNTLTNMLASIRENDYDEVTNQSDSLQYYLNQKNVVTGIDEVETYTARIEELEAEKSALKTNSVGSTSYISSPAAGYFNSTIDGYENSFDYENIADITVEEINSVQSVSSNSDALGKLSMGFTWYVVAVIDEQQKIKIESKTSVEIYVPTATKEEIPATVVSINKDQDSGLYSLVLKCNYSTYELVSVRNETTEIIINEYTGVLVNEDAIHFNDITKTVADDNGVESEVVYENVKGVYIKYGQKVTFVQIFTDITINGYAVCRVSLTTDDKAKLVASDSIELYDEVITEGLDLYDGKIL